MGGVQNTIKAIAFRPPFFNPLIVQAFLPFFPKNPVSKPFCLFSLLLSSSLQNSPSLETSWKRAGGVS